MLSLFLAAALQTAEPGEVKEFDRWAVGCDNGRSCRAVALLGDEDDDFEPMALDRGPGRMDRPVLTFPGEGAPCRSLGLFVDGKRLAQSLDLDCGARKSRTRAAATDAIIAAMRTSDRLEIKDSLGKVVARYSLKGAAAALGYMDAQQRRAGTVTALVARGNSPASLVPPPPRLPVVREVRPSRPGKGPPLSRRLTEPWLAKHNCQRRDYSEPQPSYRLDDGLHLFLVDCHFGAHDSWPLVLTARRADGRGARPARFDYDSSINDAPGASEAPVNAAWEPDRGRLTSHWTGECGFVEEWVWDGSRFRLVEHVEMVTGTIDRFSANCRSYQRFWITTWRARVVRAGGR